MEKNMKNTADFSEKLLKNAAKAGFTAAEVYAKTVAKQSVDVFCGEVKEFKNSAFTGVSFRGEIAGKTGYAYTESLTDDSFAFVLDAARENAAVSDEEAEVITAPGGEYADFSADLSAQMPPDEKIACAKRLEQAAIEADARVKKALHSYIGDKREAIIISNTKGLKLLAQNTLATSYVYVEACSGEQTKTGGEFFSSCNFTSFDLESLARAASQEACGLLGAGRVKTGAYPVVFSNLAAAGLLSCFADIFFADNVQKGLSALGGKQGSTIAAPCVTIRDNTAHLGSPVRRAFDDEAVATFDKAVIERGVLKTLLYNQKTAAKDKTASTGSGFKASFKSNIQTNVMNFFIEPGSVSLNEIFQKAENGVYITDLSGLHAGTNAVTGDFSLKADGYLIENGQKTTPIEQFTVAGNFYDWLNKITHTANNLRFDQPEGQAVFGAPAVLVQTLDISGEDCKSNPQ